MGSTYLYSMFDHNVEEQNNDDFCDYAVDTVSTSHVNKQPRKQRQEFYSDEDS